MGGGKILIFLILLVVGTFALRFVGTLPAAQPSPNATSTQSGITTTTSGGGKSISSQGENVINNPINNSSFYTPPASEQIPSHQPQQLMLTIATSAIPQGFTRNQLSPYFHKIRFAGISFPGNVTLSGSFGEDTVAIEVSGWYIKSARGGQFVPQAINVYDPTGLGQETDIYLKPNDVLRMFSSVSAIGKNFRLNKCIGSLENTNHFTPSLPGYCQPLYKDYSEISGFTGKCQDYISSLNSCISPDFSSTNIPRDDYACQSYLQNNFGFKGCFDKYRGDADFLTNEIWAWTGNDRLFDERHDRVLLFDRAGRVVDEYVY